MVARAKKCIFAIRGQDFQKGCPPMYMPQSVLLALCVGDADALRWCWTQKSWISGEAWEKSSAKIRGAGHFVLMLPRKNGCNKVERGKIKRNRPSVGTFQ